MRLHKKRARSPVSRQETSTASPGRGGRGGGCQANALRACAKVKWAAICAQPQLNQVRTPSFPPPPTPLSRPALLASILLLSSLLPPVPLFPLLLSSFTSSAQCVVLPALVASRLQFRHFRAFPASNVWAQLPPRAAQGQTQSSLAAPPAVPVALPPAHTPFRGGSCY
jgi:hypothetical protein